MRVLPAIHRCPMLVLHICRAAGGARRLPWGQMRTRSGVLLPVGGDAGDTLCGLFVVRARCGERCVLARSIICAEMKTDGIGSAWMGRVLGDARWVCCFVSLRRFNSSLYVVC